MSLLLGSLAQAVWETDPTGVVVTDSPSWRAYTGQTVDAWLGNGWLDAVHPDDRASAEKQWREAMAARSLVDAEFRLRAPDGGWRWTNVRAAPVIDPGGRVEKWVGMNVDIDARKRAEAALRDSEKKYRAVLESVDEGFIIAEVIYDDAGRAVDALYLEGNPAASRLTSGRRYDHSLLSDLVPDREDYWVETYDRVARTGTPERLEEYLAPLDRWYNYHVSRVSPAGEDSAGPRVAVVFRDVTERRRAEDQLRESEEHQAFLLKLSDALRWPIDPADLKATAMTLLAKQLDVMRASYFEFEEDEDHFQVTERSERDVPPISERMRMSEFSPAMHRLFQSGGTLSIEDATVPGEFVPDPAAYAAIGVQALAGVGLLRGGRLVACVGVHSQTPRQWTPVDLRYLTELAERTWSAVEQARAEAAVRKSEERQAFLLALGDAMRSRTTAEDKITVAARLLGERLGASRILYSEYDWAKNLARTFGGWIADGAKPFVTVQQLDDYEGEVLNDLKAGRTVRVDHVDLLADEPGFAAIAEVGVQALLSPPLMINGKLAMNVSVHQHEPRHWTDGEVALVQEVAERLWAEVVRARAEAALRESETRYRNLFERMAEGFAVMEAVRDVEGSITDFRHLKSNPASERVTGMSSQQVTGRLIAEVLPSEDARYWIDTYSQVVTSGEPNRVEQFVETLGRWLSVNVTPYGADSVAVFYEDITTRRRAEQALQESEARQTFLLKLSDALRPLVDPKSIKEAATRELGQFLNVRRAFYADLDHGNWLVEAGHESAEPRAEGCFPVESFGAWVVDRFRSGHRLVADNLDTDERFSASERAAYAAFEAHAMISVPLVKAGELISLFTVHSRSPRVWTELEIQLVEETAERIWAAIGRGKAEAALRASEQRQQILIAGVPQLVWRAVDGGHWTWASPQWTEFTAQAEENSHGFGWLDPVHPDDRSRVRERWAGAIERGEFTADYRLCHVEEGRYRWFQTRATPVRDDKGRIIEWLGTSTDVDDLLRSRELQQMLLAELQHRVRNILAVVRSIVSRSNDGERSTDDYAQHLQGRLSALARTQVLLTRRVGVGVDLEEMIRDELVAQTADERQFTLDGPDVDVAPKAAEVLTLAIHELATNATKYGAFSRASGHLTVEWSVEMRDDERWLALVWRERGVPIVDAVPRRQGFGSELVSRRIPYELKGSGSFVLRPGGLESHIEFPLRAGDSILQTNGVA